MARTIISAVFNTRNEAEQAIDSLRSYGIRDSAISVISRNDSDFEQAHRHDPDHADTKASGVGKGLAVGAGAGAVAGLAALLIPGVGPFIAAGAVAEVFGAVGSAAVTSAAVGGAIGGLTGALIDYGVVEEDARFFDERIGAGGYWVGVEPGDDADRTEIWNILHRHDGRSARYPHGSASTAAMNQPTAI